MNFVHVRHEVLFLLTQCETNSRATSLNRKLPQSVVSLQTCPVQSLDLIENIPKKGQARSTGVRQACKC